MTDMIFIGLFIPLFATLFGGAFTATFQTVDAVRYLQNQKNTIDDLYFLQSRLDSFVQSYGNWGNLSESIIVQAISGGGSHVEFVSSQIIETATSSSKVLLLTLNIDKKTYTFSYVQEK